MAGQAPPVGAFAILPNNDLAAGLAFWRALGFAQTGGPPEYPIMTGWGCEIHLIQAGDGEWRTPEHHSFGIYLRTPDVAAIAALAERYVIRPGGILRHREWGLYEVGLNGPDGLLVRVGWPSDLIRADGKHA